MNKTIAIYPGRFQPFGKHHAAAFMWLQNKFGKENTYIVTSNKVDPEKSPFNFNEKKAIIELYGIDPSHIIEVKNPYSPAELYGQIDPETTSVVFMVGEKDMGEDPRFKIGTKKDGSPSFFQNFKGNENNLEPLSKHGYLITAPHISLKVPGYGEMSGTEIRRALGDITKTREEKKKIFQEIFGWYSEKMANYIFDKLENKMTEKFSKDWWLNKLLQEDCWDGYKQVGMKKKGKKQVPNCVPINEYDLVTCEICGEQMKQITPNHLKYKHQSTLKEYINSYPKSKLLSDSLRKELRNKNPMKSSNSIKKIAETKLQKHGNPNYNNIEKQKSTIKNRYNISNIMQLPHNIERAKKQLDLIRERKYLSGEWIPAELKEGYIGYRDVVRLLTEQTFKKYYYKINNSDKRSKEWHLDHKYSIKDGYMNGIPAWMLAIKENLEIVHHTINESKNSKSTIGINELIIHALESAGGSSIQLLLCGGAAGHMKHPFDLPQVNSGKDLINVFEDSATYLTTNPAAIKIDGVNASVRLVILDGQRQFVLDRGSMKPLDVKGITKADLLDRFGEGHGFIQTGGKVLDIFNDSLPSIQQELKALGMWDNPNIMFNVEYVAGSTNVLSYAKNFLAIHGLLELFQATPKRRESKEISYNKKALESLVAKMNPIAEKSGFEVVHEFTTRPSKPANLSSILNQKHTIIINGKKESKSLKQWLDEIQTIPASQKVTLIDDKTVGAVSKEILMRLSGNNNINEIVKDPADYKAAIDGYFIYLSTMLLGDEVLESITSDLGDSKDQEGIVVRGLYPDVFKITGSFIIKGMESQFRK